jgi:hypothetical protein
MARRLNQIGLVGESVDSRIKTIYSYFMASGRAPQVWQTYIRDLIIDFGKEGAIGVIVLFGLLSGIIFVQYQLHGGICWIYLLVGVDLICAYSSIIAIISDTLVFFFFLVALLLWIRFEFSGMLEWVFLAKSAPAADPSSLMASPHENL